MNSEIQLTDAQINAIAEKAAEKAFQKIYRNANKQDGRWPQIFFKK